MSVEAKVYPLAPQRLGDHFAGDGLGVAQQGVAARKQCDLGAQAGQDGGELDGDDAAADDQGSWWHVGHRREFAVGPGVRVGQPGHVGDGGAGTGGEHHRLPRPDGLLAAVGVGDGDLPLAGEPPAGVEHRQPTLLQPSGGAVIVEVVDDGVPFREDGCDVELARPDGFPDAGNGLRQGQHLDRTQQRLGGIARPVVAFAADEALLDQGHGEAFGDEVLRR